MEGDPDDRGVNFRALEELFAVRDARKAVATYTFQVSVLEIYNEQVRDLLDPSGDRQKLEIRMAVRVIIARVQLCPHPPHLCWACSHPTHVLPPPLFACCACCTCCVCVCVCVCALVSPDTRPWERGRPRDWTQSSGGDVC